MRLERETREKERLEREVAATTDSLARHRAMAEEGKQQRTVLNSTVASLAQEKADILREKVALEVRVGTLRDTAESQRKRLGEVTAERDRLQETVCESEKRVFLAELNRLASLRDGALDRDAGNPAGSLKETLPTLLPHCSGDRLEQLLREYQPLIDTLAQLRGRETELEAQLKDTHSQYEVQLKAAAEEHSRNTENVRKRQDEVRASWRAEMDALQEELVAEREKVMKTEQHLASISSRDSEKLSSTLRRLEELEREKERLLNRQNSLLSSKDELTEAVAKAEERNCSLEQSLGSTARELEESRQKLREMETEVESLRENLLEREREREREGRDAQDQLAESRALCDECQREKEGVESALIATQTRCSSLESELLAIKSELSSMTSQLESAQHSQRGVETSYRGLLATIEQAVKGGNPLHMVETTAEKPRSPGAVSEALVRLRNERDTLREGAAQKDEALEQLREQLRASLKSTEEEREEAKSQVKSLQSSMQTLQAVYEQTSRDCETQKREAESRISGLQKENEDLKLLTTRLQSQVKSMASRNESLEAECAKMERKMKEAEKANQSRAEEVLQLSTTVSALRASQLNKERVLAEFERRLQATQREVVERELSLKTAERRRLTLEQRVARFEQQNLRQETTKRELQTHVRHIESQLKEIRERSKSLRRELVMSETERETLRGDVEQLSLCLQSSTSEKQSLSMSQEREIGRLRGEVERQLQENSALKLELVQSSTSCGSNSLGDPSVDGLMSASRTQLQRYVSILYIHIL